MLKFVRWGLVALVGLMVLAFAVIYGGSEIIIRSKPETPMPTIVAASDPGAVARGAYIGRVSGCDGCHERNLQGGPWGGDFWQGSVYTANLTRVVPHYTDSQLARAIRSGVRADGTQLWAMPSETWTTMTDAEVADVIAWLRTHSPAGPDRPRETFGPLGRLNILLGRAKSTPAWVADAKAHPAVEVGPQFARGRHLAVTVCGECHNSDLKGREGGAPDLLIAASYDLPGFTKLLRTGVAMDGKEKGLMSEVSKANFSAFTEADIAALHAYLTARAEKQ
ncbi:c-type cytochrome [Brevundimonas goettingensis]|uniref:C-type cytochrome n=1 Tax=Brevundimonas goettingensis TaxID=2774190 RepID=A0A975C0T5_9CAUL|nr:c-type cytochrome [Brevundimonas goettingensis]QTC91773.1 c-type cytochrome [Brevundimonas goettingensis]